MNESSSINSSSFISNNDRSLSENGFSSTRSFQINEEGSFGSASRSTTVAEKLLQDPTTEQQLLGQASTVRVADQLGDSLSEYTVKAGDTLGEIAATYNVSVNDLVESNNIANPDRIFVGDKLRINHQVAGNEGVTNNIPEQTYQIKPGDTLTDIAKRFGISVSDLAELNNISNPNRIYSGDSLVIPESKGSIGRTDVSASSGGIVHDTDIQAIIDAVPASVRRANPDINAHIERIVSMAEKHGLGSDQTAYVLATATHESAMGAYMEEFASGRAYEGRADLGNTQVGDGVKFKGRGYVQVTGRSNYQAWSDRLGIDLVNNPELAERPEIAAEILVVGMKEGTFTGRSLGDYINNGSVDFENARRIVNGSDRATLIAGYAENYQVALSSNDSITADIIDAPLVSGQSSITVGAEGSNADVWTKSSADISYLSESMVSTLDDIVASWQSQTNKTPVITSGNDGRHMLGSLHYQNQALDLRANNLSDAMSQQIATDLQRRLGDDYDVVFERFSNNPSNDHIHVEYDPH